MLCDFSNLKTFGNKWVKAILKSDADTMLAHSHPSLLPSHTHPESLDKAEEHERKCYVGRKVALRSTDFVLEGRKKIAQETLSDFKPA